MSKDKRPLVILGALLFGGGALLLSRKSAKAAMLSSAHKHGAPRRLSKNFTLQELLRSTIMPQMKDYKLTDQELRNAMQLTKVLQRYRDKYGPISITGGGRSKVMVNDKGLTMYEILTKKGYDASEDSDHYGFSAVDGRPVDKSKIVQMFEEMIDDSDIRQVLLYLANVGTEGEPNWQPWRLHMSVVVPGKPAFKKPGKRFFAYYGGSKKLWKRVDMFL